ncbi:flagellar basal body L-ring protein FlgH, partial [Desulfovibrio sp. OttesenSCG-928-I05]|nr:flagellar basal body L-ring protein FlgH [Desulfovibrio sp. OttesenSCG-928-I05]
MRTHTLTTLAAKSVTAVLAVAVLSGCNGAAHQSSVTTPMVTPQAYTEPEDRYDNPGSLFSDSGQQYLFSDNRARNVNDIVIIKVVDTTKGKLKADTSAEKGNTNEYSVAAAFGRSSVNPSLTGSLLAGKVGAGPILSTSSSSKSDATGETTRENTLTATLGARVVQVLPNGMLQVEGAREIRVNEETQYLVITGLIRARDIGADNSILSTQMADSRIEYWGKGVLADKQ